MYLKFRYLVLAYWAFMIFASLYPFSGWKDMSLLWPGLTDVFAAGLPRYWTGFDVMTNLLAYLFGAMILSWALQARTGALKASLMAFALSTLLSFGVEWLQVVLPSRVPSLLDWILNAVGASLGASFACVTSRPQLESWLRDRFAVVKSAGERSALKPGFLLALLALWFAAQLSLHGLAFSVGEWAGVKPNFQSTSTGRLMLQIYGPLFETVATALSVLVIGLLLQPLLGKGVNPVAPTLAFFAMCIAAKAAISARLLGTSVAFGWLSAATQGGLFIGLSLLSVLCLVLRFSSSRRWWLVILLLLALVILFNLAPESEYRRNLLHAWNPKQWRAVEALLAWLGFAWPGVAVFYCIGQIRHGFHAR